MTDAPTKVVFVDIDGPMIPTTMYLIDPMCGYTRTFPALTVAALRAICERADLKVVFNTTHNRPFPNVPNIDVALMDAGFPEEYLHPTDRHTAYPDVSRDLAVKEWLARHPEVTDWIALDDVKFTDDERLILVDYDSGLTLAHVNRAVERFGGRTFIVL